MPDETFEVAGVSVVRTSPERGEPAWAWVYAPGAGSSIREREAYRMGQET